MTQLFNWQQFKHRRSQLRRNQTEAERKLWQRIRNKQLYGHRFLRQFSINHYIVDFYCPQQRLAIELDGGKHTKPVIQLYDIRRSSYLRHLGIKVLRFWDNDVLTNIDNVLESILKYLTPPDLPFRKGEDKEEFVV